jgi:hypothetical protein
MSGRKPTCCRCGKLKERVQKAYCRACDAMKVRQWRKAHPLTPEQRRKHNVRMLAHKYWLRGKLRQKPCRRCGDANSERHHPDYSRPLFVIWLCRPCHLKLHAAKRKRRRLQRQFPAPPATAKEVPEARVASWSIR